MKMNHGGRAGAQMTSRRVGSGARVGTHDAQTIQKGRVPTARPPRPGATPPTKLNV